jgi:hypothetical protein
MSWALSRAKIELLRSLQASGSFEAALLSDDLLDCRTLRDLAERARLIAQQLRETEGDGIADPFWSQATEILLRWRSDGDASRG